MYKFTNFVIPKKTEEINRDFANFTYFYYEFGVLVTRDTVMIYAYMAILC